MNGLLTVFDFLFATHKIFYTFSTKDPINGKTNIITVNIFGIRLSHSKLDGVANEQKNHRLLSLTFHSAKRLNNQNKSEHSSLFKM